MKPRQLPGTDSVFLAMETDVIHGHVGALILLDPRGSATFSFDRIRRTVENRIHQVPRFTWRVEQVPLNLDRPYWVADPGFDPSNHLRRIAVASPGGMRELAEVCGLLASQKLDLRRPLWEMWFIEGLTDGRVAMLVKMHHCIADGVSGAEIGTLLCDFDADAPETPAVAPGGDGQGPPAPTLGTLLRNGMAHLAQSPLHVAEFVAQSARRAVVSLRETARAENAPPGMGAISRLRFNRSIGPRRAFAFVTIPMEDVRHVRAHLDVKINDILVELSGSAMRRYLEQQGELPRQPLAVMCAVSTRGSGDKAMTNQVATMNVSCATDVRDPVARLQRIHRNAAAAKEITGAVEGLPVRALGETFPPALIQSVLGALGPFGDYLPVFCNAAVSNVPGPPVPLFAAGARIEAMFPISVLGPGVGLNFTAISYNDRLDFGVIVDPDLCGDPWAIADGIPLAMADLKEALAQRSDRGERKPARGSRTSTAKKPGRVRPAARRRGRQADIARET